MHTVHIGQWLCSFLAGFRECCTPKFRLPPLSWSLELASSTFCILLPNASLLLLLLQRYVCTLLSQKSDWLVKISVEITVEILVEISVEMSLAGHRMQPFIAFRVVQVVQVDRVVRRVVWVVQAVRVVQVVRRVVRVTALRCPYPYTGTVLWN